MNPQLIKQQSALSQGRLQRSRRAYFNPIAQLTTESLTRTLNAFNRGEFQVAARLFESIEQRDDMVKAVATKRRKAPARFGWEIERMDKSEASYQHAEALTHFYKNVETTNACDLNEKGGFSLLLHQMMDAVGKRYAVHEIVWKPELYDGKPRLRAQFRFVPLWFFENTTGQLRLLEDGDKPKRPLEEGGWMVSTGDGLMEATSIAYLFKHLPMRDWLIYCERNGMPAIRGTTTAEPGTPEWEKAREAVESFTEELSALMNKGTEIDIVSLTGGRLPYPQLIERTDKAIATLWRGSSLGSFADSGSGISLQGNETRLIEREDTLQLAGILSAQVDKYIIRHLFGQNPRARIVIRHKDASPSMETEELQSFITQILPDAFGALIKQLLSGATLPVASAISENSKPQPSES